jgi:uncharacterized protein (TIGR02300 family)
MSTIASIKAERGIKRTCQNTECGVRFYDLSRDPIICPKCSTTYDLALAAPVPAIPTARTYQRPVKKQVADVVGPVVAEEGEDLEVIEAEEEPTTAEDDDTLIEEVEDDSPDVTGIIDAPIEPDEKI